MSFYDNTKEDSRQWRTYQDTVAQAADTAALATASALATTTTAQARQNGVVVTPATFTTATTQQLTATPLSDINGQGVTWTSSDVTKATVNASGLVTKVAAGSVVITARMVSTPSYSGTSNGTIT